MKSFALSRRNFLIGAGGVSATVALAACSTGDASSATGDGDPVKGGTLKIAFWNDLQGSIDPNQVYWIESRSLNRNFADSLTDQDPDTGEIVPWLAISWKVNADASEYTFVLRKDVTFSDGTKFDANAVKTAYDGVVALGANSTLGLVYLRGYKETTVVDDYTVKVSFTGPNAQFLQASSTTTLAILSPATYRKTPAERSAGAVIGSGPFILRSYQAAQSAKLVRRKDYAWPSGLVKNSGAAYLDAIEVSYIPEDSVRVGNLTSGDIDIAWPREPISEADQKLITSSGASVQKRPLPGIANLLLPNVSPGKILSDARVRSALGKAIDRKSYASTIYWDDYPVVASPLERGTPGWKDESALLGHDKDAAGALLDAAGWRLASDGYRHKGGRKLSLKYLVTGGLTTGPQLLQDQLKQVGIDLQLKLVTTAQNTGALKSGDYDLAGTYLTRADPSVLGAVLDLAVIKAGAGKLSQDAATAQKVSAYFAAGLATTDPTKRAAVYADLQAYVISQGVAFPINERLQTAGISSSVHGFAWTSESFLRANDIWKQA
jgi:peptide/nickel transport system substrate-binding protein